MSLDAHVGQFGTGTGTSNIAITGVGFQPKVVLFWHADLTTVGSGAEGVQGFGAATSSTARFATAYMSRNALATARVNAYGHNAAVAVRFDPTAGELSGVLDFVSLDADGFTVVPDTAFPSDVQINLGDQAHVNGPQCLGVLIRHRQIGKPDNHPGH